jgi:hypothetical protein
MMVLLQMLGILYAAILQLAWFNIFVISVEKHMYARKRALYFIKAAVSVIPWPWAYFTVAGRDHMRSLYYDLTGTRVVDRCFERIPSA